MTHRFISLGFLFIFLISCNNNTHKDSLNKDYISSYKKIDDNCRDSLIDILRPFELEDNNCKINEIFHLNVKLDSNIYSKDDLKYKDFIGIKFKPDSFGFMIMCIDYDIGGIAYCQEVNQKLIINNLLFLFSDISSLSNHQCLKVDKWVLDRTKENKEVFRSLTWSNIFYGKWKPCLSETNKLNDSRFNNYWIFKAEKEFSITNKTNDTLMKKTFEIDGQNLKIKDLNIEFDVLTLTSKAMLIKDHNDDKYLFFYKQR